MVQVFAAQQGGETPGNLYPSFSSTPKCKRKMVHIEFDPDDHKSDQCELVRNIKQSLCDRGLLDVFVGWEHTCLLPEDTYVMTFTSTDWNCDAPLQDIMAEVVCVSSTKAIIKPEARINFSKIKQAIATHNLAHGATIRKICGFDGKFLWQEEVPFASTIPEDISKTIEVCLQHASGKRFKNLVNTFVHYSQNEMTTKGYNLGGVGIEVDWANAGRLKSGSIKFTFPTVDLARTFHHLFQDMEWPSDNGTQTIIVRLRHNVFDIEMLFPETRLARCSPNMNNTGTAAIGN